MTLHAHRRVRPLVVTILLVLCCATAPAKQVWRLRLVDDTGFGDLTNTGVGRIFAHGKYLYLGTWNGVKGCKVYRSSDGEAKTTLSSR